MYRCLSPHQKLFLLVSSPPKKLRITELRKTTSIGSFKFNLFK